MITLREKQYGKQFCSFDPMTMGLLMGGGSQALQMGGTVFGGLFGSSAEKKRAAAIKAAGEQGVTDINAAVKSGVAEGNAKLDTARGDLSPFRNIGLEAGNTLADMLMGRKVPSDVLKASDLFKFQSDLGSRNINRELAARGLYGSGAGLETLARFNDQLVGEEGQRMVDRLSSLTGMGANVAGNMADMTNRTGLTLADMIFKGGTAAAHLRYDSAVGAAGASANATKTLGQMGKDLFGQAGDGLMQYGNFKMYQPQIEQSMKLTDMMIKRMGMGMTSDGESGGSTGMTGNTGNRYGFSSLL